MKQGLYRERIKLHFLLADCGIGREAFISLLSDEKVQAVAFRLSHRIPRQLELMLFGKYEARLCTCCVLVVMACATNRAVGYLEELQVDMEYNYQQLYLNP